MPYKDQLQNPRWQAKRLAILERAQFRCEYCGARDQPLHIHHRSYRRGAQPWEYPDENLKCLCAQCHEIETYLHQRLTALLRGLDIDALERVLHFVEAAGRPPPQDLLCIEHTAALWQLQRKRKHMPR